MKKAKTTVKLNIFVENESDFKINKKEILSLTKKITKNLLKIVRFNYDYTALGFDILFCEKEKIRQINKEYRKIDKPTDVITFSLFSDSKEKIITDGIINLGEIIICPDVAKENVSENVFECFENEILILIAHGILHLLGFDHQTNTDYNFVTDSQKKAVEGLSLSEIPV